MNMRRTGQIAVIFRSLRSASGDADYAEAAVAMERLVVSQPGYCGHHSARDPDGWGITVSYWADRSSAIAWRDHPEHRAIRNAGRSRWYDQYDVVVAEVERDYAWTRG